MDQTRALAALAPFLALTNAAASPRAAAELIEKATSAQNTYVFTELLAQPNIAKVQADEQYASHHRLLEIFSWGTWETYKSSTELPRLNDTQILKLRLLSLLSYAAEKNGDLSYTSLCRRLDLSSTVDLEHLVTTAIYSNLLTATLNPAEQVVLITSVAPLRDLAPGSVKTMLADLAAWSGRCDAVLADLEAEIAKVKTEAAKKAAQDAKLQSKIEIMQEKTEKSGKKGGGQALGSGKANNGKKAPIRSGGNLREDDQENDGDAMDIDSHGSTGGKGRFGSFFSGARR